MIFLFFATVSFEQSAFKFSFSCTTLISLIGIHQFQKGVNLFTATRHTSTLNALVFIYQAYIKHERYFAGLRE